MGKNSGFTLVELLIALCIIAILSGFTIINFFRWLPKYQLGNAARNMQCIIQLARVSAISENSTVTVEFSAGSNSCLAFVDNGDGAGGVADDGLQNGNEKLVREIVMPPGIQLNTPTFGSKVQFNNRGLPNASGDVVVENDVKSKTVRLRLSGKSSIQ